MPTPPPVRVLSSSVRALRILAQGLPARDAAPLVATLARTGWLRTLGGSDVYLGARARLPSLHSADLDDAVLRRDLQVVPAARGCMYLVPRADAPLCLRLADLLSRTRNERDAERAGIVRGEVDRVAALALATLRANGPSTTDGLRRALPEGAVRSLGERGKMVGISSPLPQALRQLEFAGEVERTPEGGRLDTERYLWRAAAKDPFAAAELPEQETELHALLLAAFARWAGVATLRAFADWAGIGVRDAKQALARADVVPLAIDGAAGADETFGAPGCDALLRDAARADEAVALLPFEDNLVHLAGGAAAMVEPEHHALSVPSWGGSAAMRLGDAPHLAFRSVLADGAIRGFWEYDPDARTAVVQWFATPSKGAAAAAQALAASTGTFLAEELGHGHSFSLDTDDELRKRLRLLRELGGARTAVAVATAKPAKPKAKGIAGKPAARSKAKARAKPSAGSRPKPKAKANVKAAAKPRGGRQRTGRAR